MDRNQSLYRWSGCVFPCSQLSKRINSKCATLKRSSVCCYRAHIFSGMRVGGGVRRHHILRSDRLLPLTPTPLLCAEAAMQLIFCTDLEVDLKSRPRFPAFEVGLYGAQVELLLLAPKQFGFV